MPPEIAVERAIDILEHATAVVIPVYFPLDTELEQGLSILRPTVQMFAREVAGPRAICLSVDGPGPALEIAQRVAADTGVGVIHHAANCGKLAAVRHGMLALLASPQFRYFATVDQDGDHFGNDLLNLVRAAEHAAAQTANERVLVLGGRQSRHRPLGFLRGEQEALANALLLDALTYHAAVHDNPLVWQFVHTVDGLPDFHSGYKLFSRAAAEAVFTPLPDLAGGTEEACYRHACEAVMTVEALLHGATLAGVTRHTFDEQPISLFASLNRSRLAADMILWPCKRLGVPAHFVAQWLTNHLPHLLLGTLTPQGRDELLAIRALVLEGYGLCDNRQEIARPRFI
jgi:hypothetical protein